MKLFYYLRINSSFAHFTRKMLGITISRLLPVIGTAFGIQAASLLIAVPLQTERFYDLSGSSTYLACLALSIFRGRTGSLINILSQLHLRQLIVGTTTTLWAGRLAAFLVYRINRDGKDTRFDKIKVDPLRFSAAWIMQAFWISLTALPCYALLATPASRLAPFGALDSIGLTVWILGFLIESISDWQKLQWQARIGPELRKTSFINEGLWSFSRHPNYFGEITLWFGNFLLCSAAFRHLGVVTACSMTALFSISPLFITSLLFRVSGIPLLEKSSDRRFGHLKEYQNYKKEVPVFFPKFTLKKGKEC
jgi:steroid 5-alpha reductase family enzyme